MSDITKIITYKRGSATNKQRTAFKWFLYIGGLCVGEIVTTPEGASRRLNEIYKEIANKTAAAGDAAQEGAG